MVRAPRVRWTDVALSVDGRPLARTAPHGGRLDRLSEDACDDPPGDR
jgi:hypothetical protein